MSAVNNIKITDRVLDLKGIGPKKARAFEKLRIEKVQDFFYFYPRDYEDRREVKKIGDLIDGDTVLIRGQIALMVKSGRPYPKNKQTLKLLVQDDTGGIEVVFFSAGYLERTLSKENTYEFYGKVSSRAGKLQMVHPDFNRWQGEENGAILPVYPLTEGISQAELRKHQKMAAGILDQVEDYMPEYIVKDNRLCSLKYALSNIHFPKDRQRLKEARYRLIFDELFLLQTGLMSVKKKIFSGKGGLQFNREVSISDFTDKLPFKLTGAQLRVIEDIEKDVSAGKVMNRLVQGDVGSGKTAVAAAAIFKAVKSGYQAVMMAPTSLLAKQHYESLKSLLSPFGIEVGFLASSVSAKDRRKLLEDLWMGRINLLIGTHAVIQPGVEFQNLGLVVTDEQHRFGVRQRNLISEKGENPHVLVTTATPIPRTLAMILYGDLDISVIDELPPGRKAITTKAITGREREMAYEFIRKEITKGRQAYIVAPLIEESQSVDAKSAEELHEELSNRFREFEVALLHGGMKPAEKDDVMERFADNKINVLVSTVVIEVGINVPNATVMLVENAERFGLAQLHQLRGRVGRGEYKSSCILLTEGKTEVAKERARIMTESSDGFVIAEKDLELRGPGEFFGVRQHGVPELQLADLSKHMKILIIVRETAEKLLENDPFLEKIEHKGLKEKIQEKFKGIEIPTI